MTQDNNLNIEQTLHDDLHRYLVSIDKVDSHFPDAPDIEDKWVSVGEAYLPDAMREFEVYPTVALGWIMFVGMAVAKYWDDDWELYSKVPNLYTYLRDRIDFDHLDDYVCEHVLLQDKEQHAATTRLVGECASRTSHNLLRLGLEPGTAETFRAFVSALHQMYLMGAAVELKALGYHMTKL